MSERSILQKDFLTKEILETKTSRIDDLLQEKLENAIHKQTSKVRLNSLVKIACEYSPVDLAIAASLACGLYGIENKSNQSTSRASDLSRS